MNNDINGVSILNMVANKRVVGENEAARVLKDFDEKGFAMELIEFGLDFSFELGD
jgi:hypothetical protein